MTNQEVINKLQFIRQNYPSKDIENIEADTALYIAIENLKAKNCAGCVREDSRELEEICNYCCRCKSDQYESREEVDDKEE